MDKKELTIVTAFFNVGRENFSVMARTNQKYVEFFKFWARIQNNLVIYTDKDTAKEVLKVRRDFGLEEKTKIIEIDDVYALEADLYEKMNKVASNQEFLDYRYVGEFAENNAKYDYIVLMKAWFIKDAVEKGYARGMIAWIDFGFNHGGKTYLKPEEFDFLWETTLPNDKVTIFSKIDDDNKSIFRVIQSYETYIMAGVFMVPSELASPFWEELKKDMEAILMCGFVDDEQTIMLMAARNCNFINVVRSSDWSMALKENGGEHLTVKEKGAARLSFKDKLLYKYRVNKRNKNSIKKLKRLFTKNYLD